GVNLGLAGWVALIALALGFTAWAGGARRDPRRFRATLAAWGFLAPAMGHLVVFSFVPALFTFYLAFHRWDLLSPARPFVGLANFRQVFGDGRFLHSLGVTAVYTLNVPATLLLALAAAVLLDRSGMSVRLLRTILFVPFISSVVAVALVWQWMYQPDAGLLNQLLRMAGITGPDWLGDPRTALLSLIVMSVWVQVGYQMVVLLGGLQAIPPSFHDAARVDGAGPLQRFRWITLPLLRPTVLFVLVTGIVSSFQVFTYVAVMTDGGPLRATDVAVFRIYQEAWEFLRFGTASAMSVVLLVLLLALTWLQFRWLGRRVEFSG
ncbi:MAG TPA: sugar ABC transporter permease, partial [Gemmatimonadales bacterium]|nr:sugar ABC transporter permease [Gemmatimonadales bacterium]